MGVDLAASPHTDGAIARALADCTHCLGAYRVAAETHRVTTCPGCGWAWRVEPPRVVDVPADLDALARWLPAIVGRAMPLAGTDGRAAPRLGERPDHVDEHHRDRRSGLRTALEALSRLDAMERAGRRREVRVLWYAYVLTGPELVKIHAGGLEDLVATRFASKEQLAFWRSHKSANVRRTQIHTHGSRLLSTARAAYESFVRGPCEDRVPVLTPVPTLTEDLGALITRTAARLAATRAESTESPTSR